MYVVSTDSQNIYLSKIAALSNTTVKVERAKPANFQSFPYLLQYCTPAEIDTVLSPRKEQYCIWH